MATKVISTEEVAYVKALQRNESLDDKAFMEAHCITGNPKHPLFQCTNIGWTIIACRPHDGSSFVVLGRRNNSEFVTWQCNDWDMKAFYWGHYFTSRLGFDHNVSEALLDFRTR